MGNIAVLLMCCALSEVVSVFLFNLRNNSMRSVLALIPTLQMWTLRPGPVNRKAG